MTMTHEQFKELLNELDESGIKTLSEKNIRYSSPNDALQNFHEGAEIMGCTTAQACWGYMTKHLSALRKMILSNDFTNREDVKEKIQDSINYLRFIWAISEEERNKKEINVKCEQCEYMYCPPEEYPCRICQYNYSENSKGYNALEIMFRSST